jgi:Protein of unknown function (DUF2865)
MPYRRHLPIGALGCALAIAATASAALAQGALPPPPGPPSDGRHPVCVRLEGHLAALDRGAGGADGRAEQIKRYEEAANKQQAELDRAVAQSRRLGCDSGGFFLFRAAQHPQCDPLNAQIRQMRTNLDQMLAGLNRLQGGGGAQDEQRRAILIALGQNGCGPQYRVAEPSRARGLFDSLFGSPDSTEANLPEGTLAPSGAFRTVCVRTCDGYYFPISYSTTPARFGEDERACQRMCPAAEVALFTHRTTGEDMKSAVSINGRAYSELPNAFRYRQELNPACSCRRAGESWAAALGGTPDDTVQRGDIVVTDDKAKALSQPQPPKAEPTPPARQQQPSRQDSGRSRTNAPPAGARSATPPATAAPLPPPGTEPAAAAPPSAATERPRSVGPQFYR